jgi:hypothetical protein
MDDVEMELNMGVKRWRKRALDKTVGMCCERNKGKEVVKKKTV